MTESLIIACVNCNKLNRVPENRLLDGGKCGSCKSPLFSGHPVPLTQSSFETHVVKSDIPVLVDFWAPWCGPCKMMAPVFEEAAQSLEPKVRVAKVNTEEEQMLAARYNIRSIPTLILFHQGKEVERISGAMNLIQLTQWTNNALSKR